MRRMKQAYCLDLKSPRKVFTVRQDVFHFKNCAASVAECNVFLLSKTLFSWSFLAELASFKAIQMRFLLFLAPKMTQMTRVPSTLTTIKAIKMKFL